MPDGFWKKSRKIASDLVKYLFTLSWKIAQKKREGHNNLRA